jgi:hypothetical protein
MSTVRDIQRTCPFKTATTDKQVCVRTEILNSHLARNLDVREGLVVVVGAAVFAALVRGGVEGAASGASVRPVVDVAVQMVPHLGVRPGQ